MYIDKVVPATPETPPNNKYKVPISLWFVEKIHLSIKEYDLVIIPFNDFGKNKAPVSKIITRPVGI